MQNHDPDHCQNIRGQPNKVFSQNRSTYEEFCRRNDISSCRKTGVGYLSSMLKSIVTVKSSAYEYAIGKHYDKLREDELREMASYRTKWAITGLFYNGVFGRQGTRLRVFRLNNTL